MNGDCLIPESHPPSAQTIQIISTTVVKPAATPPNHNSEIQFTPVDIQFLPLHYAQRGLLFPNPSPPSIIPRLKSSLSRALSIFPPFAGRLVAVQYDDGTASFSLSCNATGALVVHAVANRLSASDILHSDDEPTPPGALHSLFSMNGAYGCEGVSNPLLVVQLTQLIDGFFMGLTFSHAVADGSSFWHFLNTWSEISRNSVAESADSEFQLGNPAPVIGNWFLHGIDPPIRFPFSFEETVKKSPVTLPLPLPLLQRIFHLSKENIAQLKARANSEQTAMASTKSISSFQSMLAHIWRAVIRNSHGLDPDEEAHCKLMVNFRRRLRPKLPDTYFGNAVLFATATAKVGDLVGKGIGFAALKLNETVERQTDEEGRRWVKEWMEKPEVRKLGAMARNSLIVADSPRFDVYGNDFGWGKPAAVRAAGNYSDGKLTVLSGKEEGSVDVQICLVGATMLGIGSDSEFMEFVG